MLDYLSSLIGRLGEWAYLLIFLVAALESAAFLGIFVPGESIVLIAGFFAAQGSLDLGDLIPLIAIGASLGDSLGYALGHHLGRDWLLRYGKWFGIRARHLERVDGFFARHGGKTVLVSRFVGFVRVLAPFMAGSSRMPYRYFVGFNVLGALLWSVSFVLLGYFLGASWRVAEQWIGRASIIVGGGILFILALFWGGRWLVRHETEVRRRWAMLATHPRVRAWRRRYRPQLAFIQARLSPEGYLGLHLTAGALVLIGATWLFGGIVQDVVSGDPLTVMDKAVAAWLHAHAGAPLTGIMRVVSALCAPAVVSGMALAAALYFWWRREKYWFLDLVLAVPGGLLLNVLTQYVFHRPPPARAASALTLTGYTFPSSHVMAATLFYGVLAIYLISILPVWRWRVLVVLAVFFLVVLMGFSRLYLGADYLSDALAAAAGGVAWLALCFTAVDTLRRRVLQND